jgi:hypothetical protein
MRAILATVLILISSMVSGQNSYQIADTTKTWNTMWGGYWALGIAHCGGTKTNKFGNEVIYGDTTYLMVMEATDSLHTNWDMIGYIREDTLTGKVFFRKWDGEGLIYDFNLQIGDSVTINNYYAGFADVTLICGNIDSVNINGQFKKRIYLYRYYPGEYPADIWIEGIGSTGGLLYSGLGGAAVASPIWKLLCCSQNDTLIYMDSIYNRCFLSEFFPKITTTDIDTAYFGKYYEFQLQHSDANQMDSISWALVFGSMPPGIQLNDTTGVLYGIPTTTGIYGCGIAVQNNDLGFYTDLLESEIQVVIPTDIHKAAPSSLVNIYPNPCNSGKQITINAQGKTYKYLEIFNSSGTVIEDKVIQNEKTLLNCSQYKKGIYLFRFTDSKNNITKIEKVVMD